MLPVFKTAEKNEALYSKNCTGVALCVCSPTLAHVLVLAHAAHVHGGSDVRASLALPVKGLETVFAVAVSAGGAHPLHGVDIAHRALHLWRKGGDRV